MATKYEDLLAQIKSLLEDISNVGVIHDYERFASDWPRYLNFFKTSIAGSSVIRGWTISSPRMEQIRKADGGLHQRTFDFIIRGYFGFDDTNASEKTARALAETVINNFDAKPDLNGYAAGAEPAQLVSFEPRMFGSVLCHYIEIKLSIRATKTITYS